ncbi:lysine N(6)-hydroxylase/L-ornithine N(5)-oxygenase family protein [Streptomyces anulatus]
MPHYDLLGIGIGPANLSLAALADPLPDLRATFVDTRPDFRWHPGLMLSSSQLTVTFFRDLVSLVDPTNQFSFINFLVTEGRAFRFLEAQGLTPSRREFEQYYQWVTARLNSLRWSKRVESVSLEEDGFRVTYTGGASDTARDVVLGSGAEPRMPGFAKPYAGGQVIHSSETTRILPHQWKGRRVLVVGAGQSGGEVVSHLLGDESFLPAHLTWTSSSTGFQPLDDSPFTNEWFSANFVNFFHQLPDTRRTEILREQRAAGGDGITDTLIRSVYQRLYHLDYVLESDMQHRLLPGRRAVGIRRNDSSHVVDLHDLNLGTVEPVPADLVIFCTGYDSRLPDYLKPLQNRISFRNDKPEVNADYSLTIDGPSEGRLFVQGFAESSHGLNDTLLSLAAWRSARIINASTGRDIYRVEPGTSTITWE